MQSPQLQLFNHIFKLAKGYGIKAVTRKEMTSAIPYPFIHVSEPNGDLQNETFNSYSGTASSRITLYSKDTNRGLHDQMLFNIQMDLMRLERLESYQVIDNDITVTTIDYTEMNERLIQSTLLVEYKIY